MRWFGGPIRQRLAPVVGRWYRALHAMLFSRLISGPLLIAATGWSLSLLAADKPEAKARADSLTVRTTVTRSVTAPEMRRTETRRVGRTHTVEALGDANAWFVVEAAVADFGEMLPEQQRELLGAFVVRVHSDRDWELRLVPHADLQVIGSADRVPLDRLAWSGPGSPGFEVFASLAPVTVARGGPTGGVGTAISIDLRLHLHGDDPLGRYGADFRAMLEVR